MARMVHLGGTIAYLRSFRAVGRFRGKAFLRRLRVIAADDQPAFLRELVSLLAVEFDVVATAEDGQSALELVQRHKPDLVVTDIHMPCLTGIEVASELAKNLDSPPVVICSVETDPEVIAAAKEAGALAYVLKSRIERDLISAAKSVLQTRVAVSRHPK
jgi:two-component system response regulator NreC